MKLKFRADKKDIVIFLIFCVVLLYLVAILVINLNSIAVTGEFRGLNPFPAFSSEFIFATILFYIVAIVAIFASCSSYFFERESGIGLTTKKKSKQDGFSKLMEEKDMKKDYDIKKIVLKDDVYEAAGFPVINDGKQAWVDNGENHSLIMGASGSGKSQCFMFTLIKILGRAGESIIVTDPKGELYEECGNLLKDKGYKVIIVNFRDPEEGSAWNPFTYPYTLYKEGNTDKANELLQDLATNILIDPNNKAEPFWENTASNFFTGLSLGLFDDAAEEEINISSINMMAEIGDERIGASTYLKEYFKSKGEQSPAYISAASCINAPADTKGGIMSTFRTKTRIFSSQVNLSEMLSHSDFDIRDIGKEKTAVFLKIHDEKTTYHALATIFVKQVYEALIAVAQTCPNLKLPYRTNFVLDEFANMPALKDVESMITASRSRNIRFSFVIQNFAQLNKVYGNEVADTIRGNCGNFVYLMSTEVKALEEISKLCGDKKPEKVDKDKPQPPIRPLLTVSDLQSFKMFEVLIKRFRSNPFKVKLTPNFKIDWGKKYDKLGYTKRPKTEVKIFDIKDFVNKKREANGVADPFATAGPKPFTPYPSFNPSPAPGLGGSTPTPGFGAPTPAPGFGMNPTLSNLDDYVKELDKKIAELEAEEKAQREKEQKAETLAAPATPANPVTASTASTSTPETAKEPEKVNSDQIITPTNINQFEPVKTEKEIEKDIANILNGGAPIEIQKDVNNDILNIEEPKTETKPLETTVQEIKDTPNKPVIEKPKVNIDVDSIVVDNKGASEDFFDDFFGADE